MNARRLDDKTLFNSRVMGGVMVGGCAIATAAFLYFAGQARRSDEAREDSRAAGGLAAHSEGSERVAGATEPKSEPVEVADVDQTLGVEEPTKVDEREAIALALPHDEVFTDFKEEAEAALENGALETALSALRKHLYRNPPDAGTLLDLARIASEMGEYAIAEQALLDARALDPANAEIPTELARVHLSLGEIDKARFSAREAIRLSPESVGAWNVAGRAAMAHSQWERAEVALRRAVELDPTSPILHNNLGLLYIYTRRGDLAVDSLETAVELYVDEVPSFVYNNLGLAHELAKNVEESCEAFEAALRVNPEYARARLNLRRVETTRLALAEKRALEFATGQRLDDGAEDTASRSSEETDLEDAAEGDVRAEGERSGPKDDGVDDHDLDEAGDLRHLRDFSEDDGLHSEESIGSAVLGLHDFEPSTETH